MPPAARKRVRRDCGGSRRGSGTYPHRWPMADGGRWVQGARRAQSSRLLFYHSIHTHDIPACGAYHRCAALHVPLVPDLRYASVVRVCVRPGVKVCVCVQRPERTGRPARARSRWTGRNDFETMKINRRISCNTKRARVRATRDCRNGPSENEGWG